MNFIGGYGTCWALINIILHMCIRLIIGKKLLIYERMLIQTQSTILLASLILIIIINGDEVLTTLSYMTYFLFYVGEAVWVRHLQYTILQNVITLFQKGVIAIIFVFWQLRLPNLFHWDVWITIIASVRLSRWINNKWLLASLLMSWFN